jgi:hypothetical protein
MSKLSMHALMERAESITSMDLLNAISGGTENSCHKPEPPKESGCSDCKATLRGPGRLSPLGLWLNHLLH